MHNVNDTIRNCDSFDQLSIGQAGTKLLCAISVELWRVVSSRRGMTKSSANASRSARQFRRIVKAVYRTQPQTMPQLRRSVSGSPHWLPATRLNATSASSGGEVEQVSTGLQGIRRAKSPITQMLCWMLN
jgi:hypothetical protein